MGLDTKAGKVFRGARVGRTREPDSIVRTSALVIVKPGTADAEGNPDISCLLLPPIGPVRPSELLGPLSGRAALCEAEGTGDNASCSVEPPKIINVMEGLERNLARDAEPKPLLSPWQRGEAHFNPLRRDAR